MLGDALPRFDRWEGRVDAAMKMLKAYRFTVQVLLVLTRSLGRLD